MHVRTRTWFAFVVVAALLFLLGSRFGLWEPLESAVGAVASPVESVLGDATRPVADFVNNFTDVNRLTDENRDLQEENERLLAELIRLQDVDRELQQLEELLAVRGNREAEQFLSANVFAREPNNQQDLIAIDRGKADGVQDKMMVLTRQGSLVGSVSRALEHTAWVRLITDPASAVSARIQESRVQGVVVGTADGTLTMEFVEETEDVKEGDLVTTSGVGGRHPPGELIGQVVEAERAAQQLFQRVRVEPLADLSTLESVLVLTSFLPVDLGAP